jgi:hypothetical protein
MKMKYAGRIGLGLFAMSVTMALGQTDKNALVAHEWGTFTSVQGADGVALEWKPLETSRLPKFVYNWKNPGLGRAGKKATSLSYLTKESISTLQRMETPVIYFYSDREQTVDVTVRFPQGLITEWYPQARDIGPSVITAANGVHTDLDESVIRWAGVKTTPTQGVNYATPGLPMDDSGSHYFAARETDANRLMVDSHAKNGMENEKFLFYRGVAHFAAPLRVTMNSDDAITVLNTGGEALRHLFVLGVKGQSGSFVYVDELAAKAEKTIPLKTEQSTRAVLDEQIGTAMAAALAKEGLYAREASAMVNTWKDSWFEEDGVRVLYVLPRAWTDRTLPIELKPSPKELVRVMVGRLEMLIPATERALTLEFEKAKTGDVAALNEARETLKGLGRFAEPAFNRALAKAQVKPEQQKPFAGLLTAEKN